MTRMTGPDFAVMCNLINTHTTHTLPLAMSTCNEIDSDVHALSKKFAIRRIEHRSEIRSNVSQHLAEGTNVARLRRQFSFVLHQAFSSRTHYHLCRQGVALAGNRKLRSQDPVPVHALCTNGLIGSKGRK